VAGGAAVQVTTSNYNQLRVTNDILLLNFYADWCRFSQQLKPIFEKAADAMDAEDTAGTSVLFGKVDCDSEKALCANPFRVSKYPTMKLVRYGEVARKEYRGKRAVDALVQYVKDQIKDPVETIASYYDLTKREDVKRAVVGFFSGNDSVEYNTFRKAAVNLRDDCPFYAVLQQTQPQIVFREDKQQDEVFRGDMTNLYSTFSWITDKCIPLVREITFQNGEEMTEVGIPLMILFYHPDHPEVKELFKNRVADELRDHRGLCHH
jgi:endoplasmic reticulum resident protein 44